MISEQIIKDKFIIDTLQSNFDEMRGFQLRILDHAPDKIRKKNFLDMKKFGNLKVYNKQIWGTVYNDIIPELKYGFSENIKDDIRNQLKQTTN